MITKNSTKQNIEKRSFIDKEHAVAREYENIMEKNIDDEQLSAMMMKLIDKDPDFYDPYLVVVEILLAEDTPDREKHDLALCILIQAYTRATQRISDKQGNWPDEMLWEHFNNRHIMSALEEYGTFFWQMDCPSEALNIFRRILRMNPQDNQALRYNILAIKLGLESVEWQEPFTVTDENGDELGLDGCKLYDWFHAHAPQFPDEFQWLLKYHSDTE